ncbi:MAG: tetratricopeptide repeat protein [Bacteroidales bacterium]|nr:tetratricopeptide repeat protein [Bacteroidales bacterium]
MKKVIVFLIFLSVVSFNLYAQKADSVAVRNNTIATARYLKSIFRIDEAIDTLSSLIGNNFDEEVLAELADCHYQCGKYEDAAGTYFMLSCKCPSNILYKVRQISVFYKLKAWPDVVDAGKQLLALDSIPTISEMVGDAYNQMKQTDSALVFYNQALAAKPNNDNVVSKAAKIYLDRKDYESAISLSDAFLANDPNNFTVAPIKGLALYQNGSYPPAIEIFENQIRLGNDNYGIHFNLGQCYWRTDSLVKAQEEFEKAWQIDSSDVNLAFSIAGVKSALCFPFDRDVKPWLDKALEMLEPDHSILSLIHQQYGLGYYKKQNAWDDAILHYKKAYEYNPKFISALSTIAYCYEQKKEYKAALQWYERYLKVAQPDTKGYQFAQKSVEFLNGELFMQGEK